MLHVVDRAHFLCPQVTYEDPFTAVSAVQWFNNQDFRGARLGLRSRACGWHGLRMRFPSSASEPYSQYLFRRYADGELGEQEALAIRDARPRPGQGRRRQRLRRRRGTGLRRRRGRLQAARRLRPAAADGASRAADGAAAATPAACVPAPAAPQTLPVPPRPPQGSGLPGSLPAPTGGAQLPGPGEVDPLDPLPPFSSGYGRPESYDAPAAAPAGGLSDGGMRIAPPREVRDGDWACSCGNVNFSFRRARCVAVNPAQAAESCSCCRHRDSLYVPS